MTSIAAHSPTRRSTSRSRANDLSATSSSISPTILEAADVAVSMTNSRRSLYAGPFPAPRPDRMIAVQFDGGDESEDYLNQGMSLFAADARVFVRGTPGRYRATMELALRAFEALHHPAQLGYSYLRADGAGPLYVGQDEAGRHQFEFNVAARYTATAAGGEPVPLEIGAHEIVGDAHVTGTLRAGAVELDDGTKLEPTPDATETTRGLVSTIAQTIAGLKTFVAGLALQAKLTIGNIAGGQNAIEIPTSSRITLGAGRYLYTDGNSIVFSHVMLGLGGMASSGSVVAYASNQLAFRHEPGSWYGANNAAVNVKGSQPDGASSVGVVLDTLNAYASGGGAKLLSVRNAGTEKAYFNADGALHVPPYNFSVNGAGVMGGSFYGPGSLTTLIKSNVPNGASSTGTIINTTANLFTPGAKLLSVQNAGVEKAHVEKDGRVFANGGFHMPWGALLTANPWDTFTDDGVTVPQYGVTWAMPQSGGAFGYLSGYSGVRVFTAGGKQAEFTAAGTKFPNTATIGPLLTGESAQSRLNRMSVLPSGYVEQSPLNFRFDQDALRYANRRPGVTITAPDFTPTDVDQVFSEYAGFISLLGKPDGTAIEVTGISIGSSANGAWFPFVMAHGGTTAALRVTMEVKTTGSPEWQSIFSGNVGQYFVAEGTGSVPFAGNLIGARWTFHNEAAPGSPFGTPEYLRWLGVISRNGNAYQWNVMRGGDSMLGNLTFERNANGVVLTSPNGSRFRITVSDAGALTATPA